MQTASVVQHHEWCDEGVVEGQYAKRSASRDMLGRWCRGRVFTTKTGKGSATRGASGPEDEFKSAPVTSHVNPDEPAQLEASESGDGSALPPCIMERPGILR
jgi:hypothetical protein